MDAVTADLLTVVERRFGRSIAAPTPFFAAHADAIARCCWAMARRFHAGGRLLAFGAGAAASDAQHIAVEFVHPVIVGKRALPALALTTDSAALTAGSFAQQLRLLARPQDIALGLAVDGGSPLVLAGLAAARERGLLTIGFAGGAAPAAPELGWSFVVPDADPFVVQEIHETLYHLLWELVHVFFEHEGLLR